MRERWWSACRGSIWLVVDKTDTVYRRIKFLHSGCPSCHRGLWSEEGRAVVTLCGPTAIDDCLSAVSLNLSKARLLWLDFVSNSTEKRPPLTSNYSPLATDRYTKCKLFFSSLQFSSVQLQYLYFAQSYNNKKAELPQRWPRDAPYICVSWKFSWESLSTPATTFPEILNGLLFRSILWMCIQNLKSVALPVPGILGST